MLQLLGHCWFQGLAPPVGITPMWINDKMNEKVGNVNTLTLPSAENSVLHSSFVKRHHTLNKNPTSFFRRGPASEHVLLCIRQALCCSLLNSVSCKATSTDNVQMNDPGRYYGH